MDISTKTVKYSTIGVLSLLLLLYVWPFYSVPTGSRGVTTQFGKIVGIENEGLVVLPPWKKLSNFSVRSERADIEKAEGATKDTQPVAVDMVVRYNVSPDRVSEVFEKYSHDGDLSSYIQSATKEVFKAVTARYAAPDLINRRAEVSAAIWEALATKVEKYGAVIINIDMTGFKFSDSYMTAINDKTTQEQLRLAADNKSETVRSTERQKVIIAQADADAAKAKADGTAYAQLKIATANADALKLQNAALQQSKDVLELRRIEVDLERARRWDGKLPVNMYAGAPIPFLNVKE